MDKEASQYPTDERITELKGLGFVSALSTAGVDETRIGELYNSYVEQDQARTKNLEEAYNTIIGK